jgi:hypothetical protein
MAIVINGERVEDEVIEGEVMRLQRSGECEAESPEELRKLAVDNVVARTLLYQQAKERFKEIPEAELDESLAKFLDEQGGKEAFYSRHGLTEADDARVRGSVASPPTTRSAPTTTSTRTISSRRRRSAPRTS